MMRVFILMVLLFVIFSSAPVPAQELATPVPEISAEEETTTQTAPQTTGKKIPEKYIKEMRGFYEYCLKDSYMNGTYDCRCMGKSYIRQRIEDGPGVKSAEIMKTMEKSACFFEKGEEGIITTEDMEEIPDEYIEEAQKFYDNCEADFNMNSNYDCQCLSVKYLDERIERGPDSAAGSVLLSIQKECPNTVGAAGFAYTECLRQGTMMSLYQPIEEYCECYANTFAKLYKNAKVTPGSQHFTALKTQTRLMCTKLPGGVKFPNVTERP